MLQYLSNAFNDPSNPWYYVIGLLFLLAIFGALAVYVIFSSKKNKDGTDKKDEQADNADTMQTNAEQSGEPETTESQDEGTDTVSDNQEPSDK
ncbi:MAG: hypothetical protein K2I75_06935 [Clostridiales bacterium]|nr:hypothetical protein [Clostridiales bacterium]